MPPARARASTIERSKQAVALKTPKRRDFRPYDFPFLHIVSGHTLKHLAGGLLDSSHVAETKAARNANLVIILVRFRNLW